MSNEKYFDFDKFTEEQEQKTVTVKAYGEILELPPEIPASILLDLVRMQKGGQNIVQEEQVLIMAEKLFGKENFEFLLENNISITNLEMLIGKAFELYTGQPIKTPSKRGQRNK